MRSRRRAELKRRPRVTAAGRPEPEATRTAGLPSPEAVLEFLRDNPEAIGAREIARAFGPSAADQPALRAMLRTISRSGELVRGGDRACVSAQLWIDAGGRKRRHHFERAVMRSAARLTYDAVQAARDEPAAHPLPLAAERLAALYGAFAVLDRARRGRGALELDLAEHRV